MAGSTFRRLLAARRGATAMEFALVAVPLMMLIFASLEFGLAMRVKSTLQYATIEAARCSVVRPTLCGTEEAVAAFARTHMQGVGTDSITFTFTAEDCGRQVVGTIPFPVVAHSVMRTGLTLSAVACYPL